MKLQKGLHVKMSSELKKKLRGNCTKNNHIKIVDDQCMACSTAHVEEFGDCVGIVEDLVDYNNVPKNHKDYDREKIGPEWNVRWYPVGVAKGLKYAYNENDLDIVAYGPDELESMIFALLEANGLQLFMETTISALKRWRIYDKPFVYTTMFKEILQGMLNVYKCRYELSDK